MGCDIHLVLEVKNEDKWVGVNTFNGPHNARRRNYDRFAAMAGVRGVGPEPRGFPDDASDTSKWIAFEYWGADGHSHSWLPLAEASKIYLETEYNPDDYVKEYPEEHFFDVYHPEKYEYRIVFWFDN